MAMESNMRLLDFSVMAESSLAARARRSSDRTFSTSVPGTTPAAAAGVSGQTRVTRV